MTTRATTASRSLTARCLASLARARSDISYASRRIIELQSESDTRR